MLDFQDEIPAGLVEVGRYALRTQAQERALVVLSMELPYWMLTERRDFVLYVREEDAAAVNAELARFEEEQRGRSVPQTGGEPITGKHGSRTLMFYGWFLSVCFLAQNLMLPGWQERGVAVSRAILEGEWWRCITALTLHGDLSHFAANLTVGLLFGAFLAPELGGGLAWFLMLLTGALGNAVNAWGYRGEPHSSIGASTAVFGALGVLTGLQVAIAIMRREAPRPSAILVPFGGGLALLALLGTGSDQFAQRIDTMAHLWGFVCGIPFGLAAGAGRWGARISAPWHRAFGAAAILLPFAAWFLALRAIFFPE